MSEREEELKETEMLLLKGSHTNLLVSSFNTEAAGQQVPESYGEELN